MVKITQRKHDFIVTLTVPRGTSAAHAKTIIEDAISDDPADGMKIVVRHADAYIRGKVSQTNKELRDLKAECRYALDILNRVL